MHVIFLNHYIEPGVLMTHLIQIFYYKLRGNMSSIFSGISEMNASEIQEHIQAMFPLPHAQ